MKKVWLFAFAVIAAFSFTACGGDKKLTEEELTKKVDETVKTQKDSLTKVLDADCDKNHTQYVQAKLDSMVNAKVAEKEAAEKEAKDKKDAPKGK